MNTPELRDAAGVPPHGKSSRHGDLGAIPARDILERIQDSVIVCDASGQIQYWNSGAERLYGWSAEEALGTNVHVLLGTRLTGAAAEIESKLEAEGHWQGELQQVGRNGTAVWVQSHCAVEGDGPNAPRLLINSGLTARKQAEQALRRVEERYRCFVDEGLTGDFIVRPDGTIVTCNPAFVRILALAPRRKFYP